MARDSAQATPFEIIKAGNAAEALFRARQALAADPGNVGASLLIATSEIQLGNYESAYDCCVEGLASFGDPLFGFLAHSALLAKGKLLEARKSLDLALQSAPENPRYLKAAGELELLNGDLERAAHFFGRSISIIPSPDASARLFLCRVLAGVPEDIEQIQELSFSNPRDPVVLHSLALACLLSGKLDYAERLLLSGPLKNWRSASKEVALCRREKKRQQEAHSAGEHYVPALYMLKLKRKSF
jgi:tetratricopeptide (TPR) repeat protein